MGAERRSHLVAVDVGRLRGLLRRHAELDDVEEELQKVLVLRVAALYREREEWQPVFQRQRGRERYPRVLPRGDHVERSILLPGDETLRPLAQSDTGPSRDHRRNPASTG